MGWGQMGAPTELQSALFRARGHRKYLFMVDRLPGWKGEADKLFRVSATNTSNFERVERLL